ncbi:hypothetical protein [uncultured Psychroserpens sp.]|uniref:hypothetical protein n=1 Tax=uncultured Psychroserpens sp. TaxID=255436 RepID=UPI0026041806|nr:hypothetical protein [uncultured Psychroserpens sp.]
MNNQELNNFIQNIERTYSSDEAYTGFFYDDDDDGFTSYIKANKNGLILFSAQLLKGALSIDERAFTGKELYKLTNDKSDLDYTCFEFSHIELLNIGKSDIPEPKAYKETFTDKIGCFVSIIIALFALASLVVGALKILSWLF